MFIVRTPTFFCWFRFTLTFPTYENTKYNKIYEDRNVQSILSISDLIVNYSRLSDYCSTLKNIHSILTIDIVLIWKMYIINYRNHNITDQSWSSIQKDLSIRQTIKRLLFYYVVHGLDVLNIFHWLFLTNGIDIEKLSTCILPLVLSIIDQFKRIDKIYLVQRKWIV